MFDSTYPEFARICRHIRATRPDLCIVAGGVAATADPERLLASGLVDLVFYHEAEDALPRFLQVLDGDLSRPPINLAFCDRGGTVHRFPVEPGGEITVDIRAQYDKINIADYCRVGSLSSLSRMNGVDVPYATVLSRRGCRAHCAFCGVRNFNGKGVRVREVGSVVDEMQHLHDRFGIRHFDWLDDDLLYSREAALALFREIGRRLPDITWVANNGLIAAALTAELLAAMEASGCIGFRIGLESGNPEVLRTVHKPTNLEKFYEFCRLAQGYPGMLILTNFIMGFPGETLSQMRDSFVCAVRSGLDWSNFYVYQHLKNTELYLIHGNLSGGVLETDYSKEGQTPKAVLRDINPVRAAAFGDMTGAGHLIRGYDVFDLPGTLVPDAGQLKEIWFTYNMVANFLLLPALRTESPVRLANAIRWLRAVQQAYPRDAAMACVLYYLEWRSARLAAADLERLRTEARDKLTASAYWQARDVNFGFSALLEGALPAIDPRCRHVLHQT